MCASSFVCSMTKFLCFYDIYFYMGWFRVTLVLEMLALTICTGQMECATFKWCVFNCKSPGDVRLCQFLDHITRYNLLSDGDLTLVMVIKLCLLNMIFFLNSLNLPLMEEVHSCLVCCVCHLTSPNGQVYCQLKKTQHNKTLCCSGSQYMLFSVG